MVDSSGRSDDQQFEESYRGCSELVHDNRPRKMGPGVAWAGEDAHVGMFLENVWHLLVGNQCSVTFKLFQLPACLCVCLPSYLFVCLRLSCLCLSPSACLSLSLSLPACLSVCQNINRILSWALSLLSQLHNCQ